MITGYYMLGWWAKQIQYKSCLVQIYEVSKNIIITRENIISTKISVTFSDFLRRFWIWFPYYHTMSLSGDNFPYIWPSFDLEAPLAPHTVPTLIRRTPQKKAREQLIITWQVHVHRTFNTSSPLNKNSWVLVYFRKISAGSKVKRHAYVSRDYLLQI